MARRPTAKVDWIAAREFPSDQVVRRSAREEAGASKRSGDGSARESRLLGLAISKAASCREALSATAPIARMFPCDLSATEIVRRYAGRGLQSRDLLLYSRLIVCEVGLLARNTCSGDKAIGARRTASHCLAISLRSHSLG